MDFLGSNLNFNMAQAQQLGLELFAADPTENLVQGRIYYNTTDNRIRLYNGTEWTSCGVSDIPVATTTDLGGIKLFPNEAPGNSYATQFDAGHAAVICTGNARATQLDSDGRYLFDSSLTDEDIKLCVEVLSTGKPISMNFEIHETGTGEKYISFSSADGTLTGDLKSDSGLVPQQMSGIAEKFYGGFQHSASECWNVYSMYTPYTTMPYECPDGVTRNAAVWSLRGDDDALFFGTNAKYMEKVTVPLGEIYIYKNGESGEENQVILGSGYSKRGDILMPGRVLLSAAGQAYIDVNALPQPPAPVHPVFVFDTPATSWVVEHNLGYRPAVTLVDDNDNLVLSDVHYDNENKLTVSFMSPQTGKVYLN